MHNDIVKYDSLYCRDSDWSEDNPVIRVWYMERKGDLHRSLSGLYPNGKLNTSKWKECKPKNVGKKNARSGDEQAHEEIESKYRERLRGKYYYESNPGPCRFFEPMLAHKYESWDNSGEWYVSNKLDGFRMIASKDGCFSREGIEFKTVDHIKRSLESFFSIFPNIILDGELYNHSMKDDFGKLQSLITKEKLKDEDRANLENNLEYHIYDMFDKDEPNEKFSVRSIRLANFFRMNIIDNKIRYVQSLFVESEESLVNYEEEAILLGYEGVMLRNDTPYENDRTKNLLKVKRFQDEEFPFIRFEEGNGNWANTAKSIVILLPNGSEGKATLKGSRDYAMELWNNRDTMETPKLVTVTHFGYTADGLLRFPVAKSLHYGKRNV